MPSEIRFMARPTLKQKRLENRLTQDNMVDVITTIKKQFDRPRYSRIELSQRSTTPQIALLIAATLREPLDTLFEVVTNENQTT